MGSGGLVSLAPYLRAGASTRLLDAATNHLDVTPIQRTERALVNVPGAVVLSHDRFVFDTIVTWLPVADSRGGARRFAGTWAIWQHAWRRWSAESRR